LLSKLAAQQSHNRRISARIERAYYNLSELQEPSYFFPLSFCTRYFGHLFFVTCVMSFTSDEVNYLIYRYLKEAGMRSTYYLVFTYKGFEHSAFTFGCESAVTTEHCHVNPTQVLPGTLIGLLQKGLQYIQLEVEACSPQEVK
jgi:hypothetical protein